MTGDNSKKIPNAFISMTYKRRRLATTLLLVTIAICNVFASIMEDPTGKRFKNWTENHACWH